MYHFYPSDPLKAEKSLSNYKKNRNITGVSKIKVRTDKIIKSTKKLWWLSLLKQSGVNLRSKVKWSKLISEIRFCSLAKGRKLEVTASYQLMQGFGYKSISQSTWLQNVCVYLTYSTLLFTVLIVKKSYILGA